MAEANVASGGAMEEVAEKEVSVHHKTPEKSHNANGTSEVLHAVDNGPTVLNIQPLIQPSDAPLMALAAQAGFPSGVPRGTRGVGHPFAPEGWSWRVPPKARINAKGWYIDSYRKHPQGAEVGSKKAVGAFLAERQLSAQEVEDIQNSYEWHIPPTLEEINKDSGEAHAAGPLRSKRKSSTRGEPDVASPSKKSPPPLADDEVTVVAPAPVGTEELPNEVPPTLDELLASPLNWPIIAKRLRRLSSRHRDHIYVLEEEAKGRGLPQIKAKLLESENALVSDLSALPHSIVSLFALIVTEGRVDDVRKKRHKISDLVTVVKNEIQGGGDVTDLSVGVAASQQKQKRKSAPIPSIGSAKASKADAGRRKSTPLDDVGPTKRTRLMAELSGREAQQQASAIKSVLDLKPTASDLTVSVNDDDPSEEEVEQAWDAAGTILLPNGTDEAADPAIEAPGTPAGGAGSWIPGANGDVEAVGPSTSKMPSAPLIKLQDLGIQVTPSGPVTKQDLEIQEYSRKYLKLEKKKRDWIQAFDEKLAKYRAHKESLEHLVAKRKQDQEAQHKKIQEEESKQQEAFDTAVKVIKDLEASLKLPETAATELGKPKSQWESSFGARVQAAREEMRATWQDSVKQLNEARKMNVEHLKAKVEVYKKLGRQLPGDQIKAEMDRSDAEWKALSHCLDEQKEELERQLNNVTQMETEAQRAFTIFKAQHKLVEKEKHKYAQMLEQDVVKTTNAA